MAKTQLRLPWSTLKRNLRRSSFRLVAKLHNPEKTYKSEIEGIKLYLNGHIPNNNVIYNIIVFVFFLMLFPNFFVYTACPGNARTGEDDCERQQTLDKCWFASLSRVVYCILE